MATGAGLRLVKSRKRKPGSGDYGLYGLTTPEGQPCFGMAEDGALTATAEDIEAHLHERARGKWRQSLSVPRPKRSARKKVAAEVNDPGEPLPEKAKPPRKTGDRTKPASTPPESKRARAAPEPEPGPEPEPEPEPEPDPEREPEPEPQPEPELVVRPAVPSDLPAIVALLRELGHDASEDEVGRSLRYAKRKHEAPLIAEVGEVVGCLAYHVIPVLQHGSVGRITLLVVEESRRREGVGTALMEEAEQRLRKKGCAKLEIVNEIAIGNATGFLRTLGLEDRAYLHTKNMEEPG